MTAHAPEVAGLPGIGDTDDVDQHGRYPYPRLSLAERDRRWALVREAMASRDLSVLITPNHSGHSTDFQANSRYLSHCGGGADADILVVFPLDGEVTVAATTANPRWTVTQDWVSDVREARRFYSRVAVQRLRELDISTQRIGVTGLGRSTRTPEGTVCLELAHLLTREFPNATLVDATPMLNAIRQIKSDEEIAFLTQSTRLVDAAIDAEVAAARPGEYDFAVWAAANYAMMRRGSEATVHFNWISGSTPGRTLTRPSFRRLRRGDVILNEIEANWAGYRAQGVQPVAVRDCDAVYKELIKVQGAIHNALIEYMRPGVTVGEIAELCVRIGEKETPSTGPAAGAVTRLAMHGRGLGEDGPIFTGTDPPVHQRRTALEANMVFIFKPTIRAADDTHSIAWGDTIVVTSDGGRRLGTREHGIRISGV